MSAPVPQRDAAQGSTLVNKGNEMKDVYLVFHEPLGTGSVEHFFHFMWGYFLPAVEYILKDISGGGAARGYHFHSCGPVMDIIIEELCPLFNFNFEIERRKSLDKSAMEKVRLPRWDARLNYDTRLLLDPRYRYLTYIHLKKMVRNHRLDDLFFLLRPERYRSRILESVLYVKDQILGHIDASSNDAQNSKYADKFLILKRSAEPDYYNPGGKAEIPKEPRGGRCSVSTRQLRNFKRAACR